jgi:hypothetical protein
MRKMRVGVAGMAVLLSSLGTFGWGQIVQTTPNPIQTVPSPPGPGNHGLSDEPISPRMEEQQARSRNTDRQKKLVADTNKLLQLATDLKTDVDKTNKDILSVDVMKKADEIEKLAHSVKERMKE